MKYNTFEKKICKKVQEIVGDSASVQVQDVQKNNHVIKRGMTIHRKGQGITPTIYLSPYYERLKDGMNLDSIAAEILKLYIRALPQGEVDMKFFYDFEQVKNLIIYRLVNREMNRELLSDIPHVDFMNLAICFCCSFWHPDLGEGTILIHNSHLEMWNVETDELMRVANANTPQLMPAELTGIQKDKNMYLYILSNAKRYMGAATILYPGALAKISGQLHGSFYILPCTVHEVIIMADSRQYSGEQLHNMIAALGIKKNQPQDFLCEYAYYYDAATGTLKEMH